VNSHALTSEEGLRDKMRLTRWFRRRLPRTWGESISVVAGPRFEPATEAQGMAPTADLWITASQVMGCEIQRRG